MNTSRGPSPGAVHQLMMSAQRRAVPRECGLVDFVSGFRVQMDASWADIFRYFNFKVLTTINVTGFYE
jgi:hypothetical protein